MRPRRWIRTGALVVLAATVASGWAAAPGQAAERAQDAPPTVLADPGTQRTGAMLAEPHVVGHTFRFGSHRVRFPGADVSYVGRIRTGHLVSVDGRRLVRIDGNGDKHGFRRSASGSDWLVAEDRRHVYEHNYLEVDSDLVTRFRVIDAGSGAVVATRDFGESQRMIAGQGSRVLVSDLTTRRHDQGTKWWDFGSDRTSPLTRHSVYEASLKAGRFAAFTGNLYVNGCTVVGSFAQPRQQLWKSCDRSVMEFPPDGSRMLTSPVPSDEAGFPTIEYRNGTGAVLARWKTPGWFDEQRIAWESRRQPVIVAHGTKRAAWVRCDLERCENASRTWKAQPNF